MCIYIYIFILIRINESLNFGIRRNENISAYRVELKINSNKCYAATRWNFFSPQLGR